MEAQRIAHDPVGVESARDDHECGMMDDESSIVFDTFGLLEHILSFSDVAGLLAATTVSQRWKEAGRSDFLWKIACQSLWKDKTGYQTRLEAKDLAVFWRPLYHDSIIESLSVRQIKSLFDFPLLHHQRKALRKCLEKDELKRILREHRDEVLVGTWAPLFSHLWFGSFASSVVDARRHFITRHELCTPNGFDMYFKILEEEIWEETDLDDLILYDEHPGVLLYHHSICYFEQNQEFAMEMKEPDTYHPTNLKWRWEGSFVQVGPYPYLTITRMPNWGWKLENIHVVLLFRDVPTKSNAPK